VKNSSESFDLFEKTLSSSDWLRKVPFEHTFRNVPHDAFMRRLLQERWVFSNQVSSSLPRVVLVILADDDLEGFARTLESCILQSVPFFHIFIVPGNALISFLTRKICDERFAKTPLLEQDFVQRIAYLESISEVRERPECQEGYLVFVKSGDVFHPSCVASIFLELRQSSGAADVLLWNEMHVAFGADVRVEKFLRKPTLEPYTLLHFNYVGYSFAFRSEFTSYLSDSDMWFENDAAHYFLLTILRRNGRNFITIPQYLFLRDLNHVRKHEVSESLLSAYRQYFSSLGFTLQRVEGLPGYSLMPRRLAKMITVIIPFRDKAELTCKAVESVASQDTESLIEIILINNQSSPQSLESVIRFTTSVVSQKRIVRLIDYDRPFNHSAECNLGAAEAKGECLVFLNNDVELISPKALEEMAAWSLVPDVGTVGIQMALDDGGNVVAAGVRARLAAGKDFNSPVEESIDKEFACYNRQTWGNSFACAAISKETFDSIGPLDEINFPNGYNDVDYNMRCRKAGLANIYLGTLHAIHRPGTSRGRSDEIYQKVLLRRKYPEISRDGLFQLMLEDRLPRPDHSFRSPEPSGSYLHRVAKKIRSLMGVS
jgi:GT2 family glycosyltransferase